MGEELSLREALDRVLNAIQALNYVYGAYAYLVWLVPLSIVSLLFSLEPIEALPDEMKSLLSMSIWVLAVVFIIWSHTSWKRLWERLSYARYRARKGGCWFVVVWLIAMFVVAPLSSTIAYNFLRDPSEVSCIALLSALISGVTGMYILERKYLPKAYSIYGVPILALGIVLIALRLYFASPWTVASAIIFLAYIINSLVSLHISTKFIVGEGSYGRKRGS